MREILFRGKLKDNGDWIYWDMLAHITTHAGKISKYTQKTNYGEKYYHYAYQLWDRIDHPTIGQYTGLKDKNRKRIFEGDVIVYDNSPYNAYCSPQKGVIVWRNGTLCFKVKPYKCVMYRALCTDDFFEVKCEVIGNIHDNPELVEEVE